MGSAGRGVAGWDRIEAIFGDEQIYAIGALIPDPPVEHGGRPRHYPHFMTIAWLALLGVFRSSRQLDADLGHPELWALVRRLVQQRFPDNPDMWLREEPMRRHHFLHARKALVEQATQRGLLDEFEAHASRIARELGLCDPDGAGSLTHPCAERMVTGDGKVVTPLYKAKPGDCTLDETTGQLRELRADPDAKLHITGSGEPAYGNKFLLVAARSDQVHGRVILAVDQVREAGAEAAVAVAAISRVAARLPGTQGVLYDGALRGVHLQRLLHQTGILPIVPVHAATGGRKRRKPRTERRVRVDAQLLRRGDDTTARLQLYSEAGTLCAATLDDQGELILLPLGRRQIMRRRNADGTWRWYQEYDVPPEVGGGTIMVRLDTTDEDRKRRFNRTEHVRPIPPGDADYKPLYGRRADIESINRGLDDTLYLTRAHSVGSARQTLDLLGYAIMVNAYARTTTQPVRRRTYAA